MDFKSKDFEKHTKQEEFVKSLNTSESTILLSVKYEIFEEEFVSDVKPELNELHTKFIIDEKVESENLKPEIVVRNEAPHPLSKEEENFEKLLQKQKKVQKRYRIKKDPEEYRKGDELIAKSIELKCSQCNINFESFHEFKVHHRQSHKDSEGYVSCCNRHLYSRNELLDHIKSHTDPEIFKCKICEKQFVSRKYMKIHMTNSHLNGEGSNYSCKFCNKGFAWISALRNHLDCHKTERSHICDNCGASFHGYSRLRAHINLVHKNETSENTNFRCELCGRHYKLKGSLLRHLKNHKETDKQFEKSIHQFGKRIQCNICPKWFKSEQSCKSHIIGEHATEGTIVHFV